MDCPFCGAPRQAEDSFCAYCGSSLPQIPPKPRRPRLPALILALMFTVGLVCFFLFPLDAQQQPDQALPADPTEAQLQTEPTSPGNSVTGYGDWFILVDGVLYFDPGAYSGGRILVVPDAIDGVSVTAIGDGCFRDCTNITTIILPAGITSIGSYAFSGCTALRGLAVPESVTSIGEGAFLGCAELEAMYLPISIHSIGHDAFAECPSLLYLFYSGFYEEWLEMYPDMITPYTWAICLDGEYRHAAQS